MAVLLEGDLERLARVFFSLPSEVTRPAWRVIDAKQACRLLRNLENTPYREALRAMDGQSASPFASAMKLFWEGLTLGARTSEDLSLRARLSHYALSAAHKHKVDVLKERRNETVELDHY